MKNNFSNQDQKVNNQNEMNKPQSDARMRAQNRDVTNEGKNLAKNPPKSQSKDCKDH